MDTQSNHSDDRQHATRASANRSDTKNSANSQPDRSAAESVLGRIIASLREDRTVPAMAREAIKDVRSTVHEVFFGQPEQGGELGAPLNPLASEIATDRSVTVHGRSSPSPGDIAYGRTAISQGQDGEEQSRGQILHQKSWQEREQERQQQRESGGSDGYDRQKERIKPEEERQKQREQERDRGGRCR